MPSQLLKNDRIEFLCCRTFVYGGKQYTIGDEFPGEAANNIETLVRARYVIPVVEKLEDKPRHWHLHVKVRSEVEEKLSGPAPVQIVFEGDEEDVDLDALTHPEPEEPNQADHMAEVANDRIIAEREAAEEPTEPEEEESEPYEPFSSNEEQLQFPEVEETEPPEPPDHVAESTVPIPEEPVEDEPEEPGSAEDEPSSQVPDGTIPEVKAWVGDDPARAQVALEAEEAGQERSTLIAWLEDRVE